MKIGHTVAAMDRSITRIERSLPPSDMEQFFQEENEKRKDEERDRQAREELEAILDDLED